MSFSYAIQNVQLPSEKKVDIVVHQNKITEITDAGKSNESKCFDYSGCYVSGGWIDLHVHAHKDLHPYGDEIDEIGVKQGVTTIVDAGSCGADNITDLIQSKKQSRTNLLAFLNVSSIGLTRMDELSQLNWLDEQKLLKTVSKYRDFIVGLKARISKSVVKDNGIKPLHVARHFSNITDLPLMVHIGSGPPSIKEILKLLEKNDIITHFLNGKKNNLFNNEGIPLEELSDAINRGVRLDVGHGSASFSFQVAYYAKKHSIYPFSISTDIYRDNRKNGPVYSLAMVATKFLYLGYSLSEVIDAISVHPAIWLRKPELSRIQQGAKANLTLFSIENRQTELFDSMGEIRKTNQMIVPRGVVKDGELITC